VGYAQPTATAATTTTEENTMTTYTVRFKHPAGHLVAYKVEAANKTQAVEVASAQADADSNALRLHKTLSSVTR
jgi:hypothetical protein